MNTVDSLIPFTLLDYLAWKSGCFCLSDLRQVSPQRLRWVLSEVPEPAFSRRSWSEAVRYLTGREAESPCEALLAWLDGHC